MLQMATQIPLPLAFSFTFFSFLFGWAILSWKLPWMPRVPMASHISEKIYRYCIAPISVSSELAKDSTKSPAHYAKKLYGGEPKAITEQRPPHKRARATPEELERARKCGNWGDSAPSELFLQCFHSALCSLQHDPLAGVVSPSLMGSHGTLPLTILAPLPDICRHMSNLIVRAEYEVFLATNFWIHSDGSRLITDALLELSRRAGARGTKVIVKVMYDRGNVKQVVDSHQIMRVKQYTGEAVQLPAPEAIPHIDMQVQNYHLPVLGTFHSKFMVVDRKVAIVQSNNIQDNDNLEMMTQVEGPIVDAFYDTALLSWDKALQRPLPCLDTPAAQNPWSTFGDPTFQALFERTSSGPMSAVQRRDNSKELPMHQAGDPHYDDSIAAEIKRLQWAFIPKDGETKMGLVTKHLNTAMHLDQRGTAPECDAEDEMVPMIPHRPHKSIPIALVNRKPWGAVNHQCVNVPQNEAWLAAIRNAKRDVFVQTPDLNAAPLIPALIQAIKRGIEITYYVCLGYNDSGELLPFQGGINEMVANKLYESLDPAEKKLLHVHYYVAKDQKAPIHNQFKKRSCHVKLMIVDGHLGIQGNGNQDTQSWYHSMEVNIMIDSEVICKDWLEGIRRNQSKQCTTIAIDAC